MCYGLTCFVGDNSTHLLKLSELVSTVLFFNARDNPVKHLPQN